MNQNKDRSEKERRLIGAEEKSPMKQLNSVSLSLSFSFFLLRPAGSSSSAKPWANGGGKTSEPSSSSHLPSPDITVTPPASKGNNADSCIVKFPVSGFLQLLSLLLPFCVLI